MADCKPHVAKIESADGVAICRWQYCWENRTPMRMTSFAGTTSFQQRSVKRHQLLWPAYITMSRSIVARCFELVRKTQRYTDPKDGKEKRRSTKPRTKCNRELLQQAVKNQIPFKYALKRYLVCSAENMNFVKVTLKKEFVMPLKGNRKCKCTECVCQAGRTLSASGHTGTRTMNPVTVYLEGVELLPLLIKPALHQTRMLNRHSVSVTSDTTLDGNGMPLSIKNDGNVEPYHKSLKQNASLEKSPTQRWPLRPIILFAALCGYINLELLKSTLNSITLHWKQNLYLHACPIRPMPPCRNSIQPAGCVRWVIKKQKNDDFSFTRVRGNGSTK